MNDSGQVGQVRFDTTRWSVVLRAGAAGSADTRDALHELFECYWYPLYAFARRSGNSHHDALDLTQGFLLTCCRARPSVPCLRTRDVSGRSCWPP